MTAAPPRLASGPSIGRQVERALEETRALISQEFARSRLDTRRHFEALARAAIGMVGVTALLLIAVSVIDVALVLALGGGELIGLVGAAVLIAVGAAAGALGLWLLPGPPPGSAAGLPGPRP